LPFTFEKIGPDVPGVTQVVHDHGVYIIEAQFTELLHDLLGGCAR
jgi:hypothetical protein